MGMGCRDCEAKLWWVVLGKGWLGENGIALPNDLLKKFKLSIRWEQGRRAIEVRWCERYAVGKEGALLGVSAHTTALGMELGAELLLVTQTPLLTSLIRKFRAGDGFTLLREICLR
jgi:hypothetical protein